MPESPFLNSAAEEPWRICYAQLAPGLLLFARQWLGSTADAEDVVQTAFVRFWRRQPDARAEHYPLLFTAVRTAALDLLRKDGRRARREEDFGRDGDGAFFVQAGEGRDEAEQVEEALRRLPPEQREVLVLRIWGELTFAQIATMLGASINTVAARHRYAIEALRRILKPHEYERLGV